MKSPRSLRSASAKLKLLALVAFAFLAASVWFQLQRSRRPAPEVVADPPAIVLSEATTRILHSLDVDLEARFYVPANPALLPAQLGAFATRVRELLTEYERVSGGKLRVQQVDPQMEPGAKNAAGAAGIVPFANDVGEIVYFGLTIGNGVRMETIAPLTPDWEAALESDLSRAIGRLATRTAAVAMTRGSVATPPTAIDVGVGEALLKQFPNLATQSEAEVTEVLRGETLAAFKLAATEGQALVLAAQRALATAQDNKSEAEIIAAQQNLRRVQAEQTSKLNEITGGLQAQLAALQQLKTMPNLASPRR